VVRFAEDARRSVDTMKRLPVRTEAGGLLTLGQVASFKMVEQVGAITREAGQRRAAILVNLRGTRHGRIRQGSDKDPHPPK
jgi:cobalt-zinc-cadmium resistance protein CzcA